MRSAYRKECWLALTAFVVAAFLTHIYPLYFWFPKLTEIEMFGFPAHYFLTLFLGWVVLMPLYALYIRVSEKIDQEIVETSRRTAEIEARAAAGGER